MKNLYELISVSQQKQEALKVFECNERTKCFGLCLSEDSVKELIKCKNNTLRLQKRIEFGESILPKLIYAFCDSQYIQQDTYLEILSELQDLFYTFKNEVQDKLTDDELISFMKEEFENICYGSVEYLAETVLERFAKEIRKGYKTLKQKGAKDEYNLKEITDDYQILSEETRWERQLYFEALEDLM